ncbi:MAG: hypothetical protein L0Z50_39710 [Verrucomicrobiales bacterium]|nr:hypothetical protein [Verrucomicrobiales bacterium]
MLKPSQADGAHGVKRPTLVNAFIGSGREILLREILTMNPAGDKGDSPIPVGDPSDGTHKVWGF